MFFWPIEHSANEAQGAKPAASSRADGEAPLAAGLPPGLQQFLLARLSGSRLVLPGDASYQTDSRTFNPRFNDRHPGGIVLCVNELDVGVCLEGVKAHQVPFRLRSAGHSLAGQSSLDGGLIIDISGLNSIRVDPVLGEATVGSGCRLSALKAAFDPHELRLPLGSDPVGVGGYVQGGGFADTSRTLGINSDNVLGARVMLADGRIVHASETVNHDLWWALRGGTGGNFGVLLDVRYALRPAPKPLAQAFNWSFKLADRQTAVEILLTLQDKVVRGAPAALNPAALLYFERPTAAGRPEQLHLLVAFVFFGSQADLDVLTAPLAQFPQSAPPAPLAAPDPAPAQYPMPVLRQSRLVTELTAAAWKTLVDDFAEHANANSNLTVTAWGGAINSYPREKSAFIHRDASFNIYVTGFWNGAAEEAQMQAYLERWREFIEPFWTGGIFQDFADTDCPDYRSSYWGEAFAALVAVKRKYDPSGLFSFSQAIQARPGKPEPATWPPEVVAALSRPIEAPPSPNGPVAP